MLWRSMEDRTWEFILKKKLMILKGRLRTWNIEAFGKLDLEVENIVNQLNKLDYIVANGLNATSENIEDSRMLVTSKVCQNLQCKECILRRKSRHNLIREGNSYLKFFHAIMKKIYRWNRMVTLNTKKGRTEQVVEFKLEIKSHS